MIYNYSYVLNKFIDFDCINHINDYSIHPIQESRHILDSALTNKLDIIYDKYKKFSILKCKKLYLSIRNSNFEESFEIRECIADIYYKLSNITNEELMKFNPKFSRIEITNKISELHN